MENGWAHHHWGLGPEFDPGWLLTSEQKTLQRNIIELCHNHIRPNADEYDRTSQFPRASLDAMADMGLLSLLVPKELGGMGQDIVAAAMAVETIARYGCPSTAMVYTMHLAACNSLLKAHHNNPFIQDLLKNLNKTKSIGTLSLNDAATGSQFWFSLSSKCQTMDEQNIRLLKYGQWCTSAGYADWYVITSASPDADGDMSSTSVYLLLKDEVRTYANEWEALGLRGNQSGPVVCEGVLNKERIIGRLSTTSGMENVNMSITMLMISACCNGIAMAAMDVTKRHVTSRTHGQNGFRVCDYPLVQEYFGECISSTMASRLTVYSYCQMLNQATNGCDWSLYKNPNYKPRYVASASCAKFIAAKNSSKVTEKMLRACGGAGFRRDLGLERFLRDSKAGWLMWPSSEMIKLLMGQMCVYGIDGVDRWGNQVHIPSLYRELSKMTLSEKEAVARNILQEVDDRKGGDKIPISKDDFDNPFNTQPPKHWEEIFATGDGTDHEPALNPDSYTSLPLISKSECARDTFKFRFALPNATDHLGCLPGQYIQMRISSEGTVQERFFSPTSPPNSFGQLEIVTKLEAQGLVSKALKDMQPGSKAQFRGPCGGFEYEANTLDHLILICGGVGVTPAIQLIRTVMDNPQDITKVTLFYCSDYVDNLISYQELCDYEVKDCRFAPVFILREPPEEWSYEEGDLDSDVLRRNMHLSTDTKNKVLICGGSALAVSCLQSLRQLGFKSDSIFIFGPLGTQLVRGVYGSNAKLSSHTSRY